MSHTPRDGRVEGPPPDPGAGPRHAVPPRADASLPPLEILRPGIVPYDEALALQAERVVARREGRVPDALILLEHPDVITLGTGFHEEHLRVDRDELRRRGYQVAEAGRGGDVTWHGPGQLVGYPILALQEGRRDLHRYLRDLEEVLIRAVATLGVTAERAEGWTGVWTPGGKIAAIGVRVSSGWITSHGFALNVSPDLARFDAIVPCGIADRPVTSLARELGRAPDPGAVERGVVEAFREVFG